MSGRFSTSYLLVDGYNIIFAWDRLKNVAKTSLEGARDMLADTLANYRGPTKQEIIIVFDANRVEGPGSVIHRHGVYIVYTREAETADEYIERVTGELIRERIHVRVATSDHLEQIIVMGQGAARLFADELLREVQEVEQAIRRQIDSPKPFKKNWLIDNLDPKTALAVEKLRLDAKTHEG